MGGQLFALSLSLSLSRALTVVENAFKAPQTGRKRTEN